MPWRTASSMSRLEVASTRISTLTGLPPPTRSISRSWIARSSLACRRGSISEISSSSRVPPWASSNLPTRRATAPVKAPFSWPNSSLSSRLSGIAAQLTEMNGLSARFDLAWMCRAMTSLPVPDSPVISTLASLGATWSASFSTAAMRGSWVRTEVVSSATAASTAAIISASGAAGRTPWRRP